MSVVRRFFRGTASLYIFSILFSRKSRVPLDAAFSYLFLFIPSLLFCAAGIISAARIHLYLVLPCCRDYFFCADASLSCFFVPQGLFLPLRFILILLFSSAGIISAARIHLYLALFLRRDYFCRPDSSLSCFFHRRDYFFRSDASLSCSFSPQGLFLPPGFISILLFFTTGIISAARIHPYLALFLHRDYFFRPDSSLSCSFSPQGLFPPPGFISILLFFSAGIISAVQLHLYLALFLRRDYCDRPDSSLSCSFPPQGLFRPPGFIPGLLFSTTGIIATARIHLYLALFFPKDYF